MKLNTNFRCFLLNCRKFSSAINPKIEFTPTSVHVEGKQFERDKWTNVTPNILGYMNRDLHLKPQHPLSLLRENIVDHMYKSYPNHNGNPLFSVYDRFSPIVSTHQNFDSLLIAEDHPSRKASDCYYLNKDYILRGHTSAHQEELISMGLDNFIVIGDVYRRDEIDSSHFPVFHQAEGVRLFNKHQLFRNELNSDNINLFENGNRSVLKQEYHTLDAAVALEINLKMCLTNLVKHLFGSEVETRWVEAFFPFTHPSFELEVKFQDRWMEVLGCGIVEQQILHNAGVPDKIGWAFGLGLERLAMRLYQIPDIRLFWSSDSGFLSQFETAKADSKITFQAVSQFPQCVNDMSFWLPDETFNPSDFYEIVRSVGGDIVEQVRLVDEFLHPKSKRKSQCYRICYRHMERTLTQVEVNELHHKIEAEITRVLGVVVR